MRHWLLVAALILMSRDVAAQGVSTSGVRGRLVSDRSDIEGRVEIRNRATGLSSRVTTTSDGRFLIGGLEPGGPYSITATAIGFMAARIEGIVLQIGETREVSIELVRASTSLDTIVVVAPREHDAAIHLGGGSGMIIDSSSIDRLPTLNRDLYDFARLVPQISTRITLSSPGLSAGGTGFRFNNFLINGISDRTLGGNVSTNFGGLRSIPLDAVREYQVLISPYDVRYGDFGGALVNAVTRSGTNTTRGSAFILGRNDDLARSNSYPGGYERIQYGLSAGGPIIRNTLHYFVAAEAQRLTYPAAGPYVGQPPGARDPVQVSREQIDIFNSLLEARGLTAGSGGRIENSSPLGNLFAQLNLSLPRLRSRGALWINLARSNEVSFSRARLDTFSLSNTLLSRKSLSRLVSARVNTVLSRSGGGNNEFLVSYRAEGLDPGPAVLQPVVRVSVPTISGGRVILNSGTQEFAQDSWVRSASGSVKDIASIPLGASHVAIVGAEYERFQLKRGGIGGTFGTWLFANMDDLSFGIADRYDLKVDFGSGSAPVNGSQYAAFVGEQWTLRENLAISMGVRADLLALEGRAPYQQRIDSLFGRRTDARPARDVEISPRVGISWRASSMQNVRGGVGLFTGRYPLAWIQSSLSSYGVGGTLTCNRLGGGLGSPPAFVPDRSSPPMACAGGTTITSDFPGDVDLLDSNLRMMRVVRASIAHELSMPAGMSMTTEAMLSRSLSDFVFVNLNLNEPIATDLQGRVIYAPILPSGVVDPKPRSSFSEVIDLRNTSLNRAYQVSSRIEKTMRSGSGGSLSYTFSRVRDVQSPVRVNTTGRLAWASARVMSGRHDELRPGISANDITHRVVLQGTYARAWLRGRSDFSFYYIGESGRPFTYVSFGSLPGRGDLNGDRAVGNDPIYVPRSSADTSEIRFSGLSDSTGADTSASAQAIRVARQAQDFESLIERTACMRTNRGKIIPRNTCREPWSNTTIASVRHALLLRDRSVELQLDAFNVLNLIDRNWGARREANPSLLEHVGQTTGATEITKPVFRFNKAQSQWITLPVESAFQLQLGLRYRF
jgi:hypothetical protein